MFQQRRQGSILTHGRGSVISDYRRRALRKAAAACLTLLAALAAAPVGAATAVNPVAAFPDHPIRIVVPYAPGGTTDMLARLVGQHMVKQWGQPVLVENQPGANGIVAAEAVSRARPDGYTLMATPLGPVAINPLLYKGLAYRADSFAPMAVLGVLPSVLAVRSGLGDRNAAALIAYARARPDALTYASQGFGSTSHLTGAMFMRAAGLRLRHIPYNGSRPALAGLMAGDVDLFFDNVATPLPFHRAGRLTIVAVASMKRLAPLPEVMTLDEAGLKGFESITVNLLVAPAGIDAGIAAKLAAAADAAMRAPQAKENWLQLGLELARAGPGHAATFTATQQRRWRQVIVEAGIRPE
jgi:tripartite-type tricarboxylate transporter receptor subunit TctC